MRYILTVKKIIGRVAMIYAALLVVLTIVTAVTLLVTGHAAGTTDNVTWVATDNFTTASNVTVVSVPEVTVTVPGTVAITADTGIEDAINNAVSQLLALILVIALIWFGYIGGDKILFGIAGLELVLLGVSNFLEWAASINYSIGVLVAGIAVFYKAFVNKGAKK